MLSLLKPRSEIRLPGFAELVALVAALMAANALAIDIMLPALPAIGSSLGIVQENHRQWIITAYMVGFGVAHLVWGPLADRFGRRPVLIVSLSLSFIFSTAVALAGNFTWLILCRVLHGTAAAGVRVVGVSIVRDCYSGRQMARVMSLAFIVFMAVPVLAPSLGQLVLHIAEWRWVFGLISIWTGLVLAWTVLRLPETLHPEYRIRITPQGWYNASRIVLTDRCSVGYTLALSLVLGTLYGFINSSQQVFFDVFNRPEMFTYAFAGIAGAIAVASLVNAQIVQRQGMRRVSHAAVLGFLLIASTHAIVTWTGHETFWIFVAFQALMMGCFGLASANFSAMAMENLGEVAGTAASLQGFITTITGSVFGFAIGQSFDGTTGPMVIGYLVLGSLALFVLLATERWRLFQPHHEKDAPAHP